MYGKRMKKLIIAVVVILMAGAAGVYFLAPNANEIVREVIEEEGSKATKSHVTIGMLNIQAAQGTGEITELNISNPEGFSKSNAIEVGTVITTLNMSSLNGDSPIVISNVTLDEMLVNYEIGADARNNLQTLQNNTKSSAASVQGKESRGHKVIIEMLTIAPSVINVTHKELDKKLSLTLPEIQMRNIGLDGEGANATEIMHQVLTKITSETVQTVSAEMIKELGLVKALETGGMGALEGNLKEALDKLKK
jgi:uncharacterized protein involved in outer membrane biogenesis